MNQKTLIWIVVVVVVVALGVWYFSSNTSSAPASATNVATTTTPTAPTAPTETTNQPAAPAPAATNSFKSIFTQSGNNECTYEEVTSAGQSSSAIYISAGKMRGEFQSTTGSVQTTDYMIYNGGYLYTWQAGMTVG